ncbi:hypothetical protein Tco_0651774 [Tanacetum coccineum]|uniref:Uncharacterized protein n=1 Tax=Tanacetum coccineum TaxID=301880 RepID=A0ABQ4WW22_9ASTR
MEISIADQIALDDALVAPADRLKIGKCNLRLSSDVTSKEATLQVVYDVLKLTPFYKAFQVTADAPEIYMQEFWASAYVHNRSDILQIAKVGNKKFEEPPLEKEILAFLASLGHSGDIRKITDVNVNKLHQPWRSFAAIINKCLSGKPSYEQFRLSNLKSLALTNEDIRNSESYKEYYAIASGMIPPKTKGSKKKADTDTITKQKPPTVPKEVKEKKSRKGKQKSTDSGADEGTGVTPGVPDAPAYDSEDDISWKSSDDDQDDEKAQDDADEDKNDANETTQDDEDDDEHDDDERKLKMMMDEEHTESEE